MSSRPPIDGISRLRPLEVAVVGNDLVLAAFPARPVQLAHAMLACGFDHVVPVSWGEELVAEHALRALAARTPAPVIVSACASARARLLAAGPELESRMVAFVSPAVATARYLRALQPTTRMRITYVGACETRGDAAINAVISPSEMLRRLAERGISAVRQPAVFEGVIPPDRRRHFSSPGGAPFGDALLRRLPDWRIVAIEDEEFSVAIAELLLLREPVVIDVSKRLGCACCSAVGSSGVFAMHGAPGIAASLRLEDLEPPRSPSPVLDHDVEVPVVAPAVRAAKTRSPMVGLEPAHEVSPRDVVVPPTRTESVRVISIVRETPSSIAAARDVEVAAARAFRRPIAITPSSVPMVAAPLALLHATPSHSTTVARASLPGLPPASAPHASPRILVDAPGSEVVLPSHAAPSRAVEPTAAVTSDALERANVGARSLRLETDARRSSSATTAEGAGEGTGNRSYHFARRASHARAARAAARVLLRTTSRRPLRPTNEMATAQGAPPESRVPETPSEEQREALREPVISPREAGAPSGEADAQSEVQISEPVTSSAPSTSDAAPSHAPPAAHDLLAPMESAVPAPAVRGERATGFASPIAFGAPPQSPRLIAEERPVGTMRRNDYAPHGFSPAPSRSLLSFILTAVGIVLLILAVAMIFRRNPMAPW